MATPIYAIGSNYNNLNGDLGWISEEGKQVYIGVYSGSQYAGRFQFSIPAIGDGRPVEVSSAYLKIYRNHNSSATPSVQLRLNSRSNSSYSSSKLTAGTTDSTITLNAAQRKELLSYQNKNLWFYIDGTGTRARFTGHQNGSYTKSQHPRLYIDWVYSSSTATVASKYYDNPVTLTITKAYSNYTHKVEWLLPDGTVYYTHSLGSATSSTCTFYGDEATNGTAELLGDFFAGGNTATFKVCVTTLTSSGSTVGSKTYSFSLNKPTGYSMGSIQDTDYNLAATLNFTPAYDSYYHIVKWYIKKDSTPIHSVTIPSAGNTDSINTSFSYFGSLNPDNYFTIYSDKCKASVSLETYTAEGNLQGIQSISFKLLKPQENDRKIVELSPVPIILDTSVIVTNPASGINSTLNNFFEDFEEYILDTMRPIGSIYLSYDGTSPSSLFGGTWVSFGQARTLYTTTSVSSVENTGGSFTHTLTQTEMPKHRHQLYRKTSAQYEGTGGTAYGRGSSGSTKATGSTGNGTAHNNTQPYAVCYMWKRTA